MKIGITLRHFVNECLWKSFCDSDSPKTLFKLNLFDNFVNSKPFQAIVT